MLEIVRDLADYPTSGAARDSLPELYAEVPYVGVWRQSASELELPVYVFSERTLEDLAAAGWMEADE